ncbi:cis-L-3-hydroxyproline dehydratase (plasmid) [Ensifer sp. WSM1721]|uniref:cis-3-hydroxy-L-proline dehydratase n=1 Tax=Ensifer sp. WSM1721 TaxID=1041159 RepID=UPI00047DF0B5|nr:aconitase X [Ensifer sp. WSM1721]
MNGECLVAGVGAGELLFADVGLSFMGGVHSETGLVIDTHHPLHGSSVSGKILAIPSGRGSCAGSLAIFELIMNGHAPRALIFYHKETILTLGVVIAREFFQKSIPVVCLSAEDFASLAEARYAVVYNGVVDISFSAPSVAVDEGDLTSLNLEDFELTEMDGRFLDGEFGDAGRVAMRTIIRTAQIEGANSLVDVDMAHIDGCFYHGPGVLQFAKRLLELGGRVRVPSSMNALCVDRRQWKGLGVNPSLGAPSDELADAYRAMGVKPTYTCAPYLLDGAPAFGQRIAWAESNAVVFANSVLGARTMKFPDYLDILVAMTGRAPNADCYLADKRLATLRIDVPRPDVLDDSFWPALGYHVGKIATNDIPVLAGLEGLPVSHDDLKAFGAAFATTSAVAMFHIVGATPEAGTVDQATGGLSSVRRHRVTVEALTETWHELNNAPSADVDLVSLGNPHFSLTECERLAALCAGRKKADKAEMIVTCGRDVFEKARKAGFVDAISKFGGRFLNDTCWCLIAEPVIAPDVRHIMTNSGKYAHYGPAAVGRGFHFGSLERCVDAACNGVAETALPGWLSASAIS